MEANNNDKAKQTCKNKRRGCGYENANQFLLLKHVDCFCKHDSTRCPVCGSRYQGSRWIDHLSLADGLEHALEFGDSARIVLVYKNWDKFRRYTVKAFGKLFIFWFLFGVDVISMAMVVDEDDFGFKYFQCEYKVYASGLDKCVKGNLLPSNALDVYQPARDWRKDIYVPHSNVKKLYDGEYRKCNVQLTYTKYKHVLQL